jgi:CHAT domain-containing protein/tetratricopeptide (TPR) repeat protein
LRRILQLLDGGFMSSGRTGVWWIGVLLACLQGLAQDNRASDAARSLAGPSDAQVVRDLVDHYLAAYAKKDLDGMMELWSSSAPGRGARKQQIQDFFASTGRITVSRVELRMPVVEEGRARVRVKFDLSGVDAKTGSAVTGLGEMIRSLEWVKEAEAWRLWSDSDPTEELVSTLVVTLSEQERTALLSGDQDLITARLVALLMAQGDKWDLSGNYPKALGAFTAAAETAGRLNDKTTLAYAEKSIGFVYIRTADYAKALAHCQNSLKIAEKLDDGVLAANALNCIGAAQILTGDPTSALASYKRALGFAESAPENSILARILTNLGSVLGEQGQFVQAREYLQRASLLLERSGDFRYQARALRNLGIVWRNEDKYSVAMEYYQQALAVAEKANDQNLVSYLLTDIGDVFNEMGNFPEALDYFRRSIAMAEKQGAKGGLAWMLETTANVEKHENQDAAALRDYGRALNLAQESGDKNRMAAVLWDLGDFHAIHGDYTAALDSHLKSLALAEELQFEKAINKACYSVSLDYYRQNNFEKALEFADRALSGARSTGDREELLWGSTYLGMASRALGQTDRARAAFAEAIATAESMRLDLPGGAQERPRYFGERIAPYQEMVAMLVAQKKTSEALKFAEQAKGKALLDLLQSGNVSITKAMTADERQQESQAQAQLVFLNRQLEAARAQTAPDPARVAQLKLDLESARVQYAEFRASLYAAHPELRTQRGLIEPISLSDASRLLPDGRSALLEFVVAEEKTYLFALTGNAQGDAVPRLEVYTINIKGKELAQRAEQFRRRLSARDLEFGASAARLYDLLLRPAQVQLSGVNSLLIVPDGPLWNLPFQALRSRPGRYLLEDYAISYAPSLTALRQMAGLRLQHVNASSGANAHVLLAMGNPALATATSEHAKFTYRDEKLAPLPEAAKEVEALKSLYGAQQSQVFVGAEAAEDRFKEHAGEFNTLHLATHGLLNDSNPMYSHLLLSPGNDKEDGLLEAWEIMDLDLHADLAVLSACETARGQITPGEGVIGLSWAFFVAGVPATVVSQWSVESSSTAELMLAFHRNLKRAHANSSSTISTARALQRAELQLLHTSQYSHPFYWAGFIAMGDAR